MIEITMYPGSYAYKHAQRSSNIRKSSRVQIKDYEADIIADYYRQNGISPANGICHGARMGEEVDMFAERLDGKFIGTDMFKRNHPQMVKNDFRFPNKHWIGGFSFLYSNSLDHTDRPQETVKVWMGQLAPGGLAFIHWSYNHIRVRGGDCFGASLDDYILLWHDQSGGKVRDLLWVELGRVTVIVVSK